MLECNNALKEADGDFEKAKEILREKGKAAAAKRAERTTAEGVASFVAANDGKTLGGVVLESETDFVARNEEFIALANTLAGAAAATDPGSDPLALPVNGTTAGELVEQAVAKIRENIKLAKAVQLSADAPIPFYIHHDKKKATAVVLSGNASTAFEAGRQIAIHATAFPPRYIKHDEVPQDVIAKELELETKRAIEEGKDEKIAANIAQGRVNKEFFSSAVLEDQPFYTDPKKTVKQWLAEQASAGGGTLEIVKVVRLGVGEG